MSIALCMIVRNEEKLLERALYSAYDTWDQAIVVDTGSTDGTKKVAESVGAKVFDFPWVDDFSAARNFAMSKATADWVMNLDADDELENGMAIRAAVESAREDVAGFMLPYVYERNHRGDVTFSCPRERVVRNDGRWSWKGVCHEVMVNAGAGKLVTLHDVRVLHHPDPTRERKLGRNLRILQAHLPELDSRLKFYYARELKDNGLVQPAIQAYRDYLNISTWDDEKYQALIDLARLMGPGFHRGWARQAMELRPLWPEAYVVMAWADYFDEKWARVVDWLDLSMNLLPTTTGLFTQVDYSWLIIYTYSLYKLGRTYEALKWTRRALEYLPENAQHEHNLEFFQKELGS